MVTVVIDIDGVTFDTQEIMERRLQRRGYDGFSLSRILCYDFNKSLTNEGQALLRETNDSRFPYFCNAPREAIFEELADPLIYEEVIDSSITEWGDKLRAFVLLGKMMAHPNVRIVFQSVSYTECIADAKERALERVFCSRDYEYVPVMGDVEKPMLEDATYVIEDNVRVAKNCTTSEDRVDGKPLLLLIRKSWNNPVFDSTIKDTDNTYNVSVDSLYEALEYIYERECGNGTERKGIH